MITKRVLNLGAEIINLEVIMSDLESEVKGGSDQRKRRGTAPKLPRAARPSVLRQLAVLQTLSLEQLHEKWLDLYDSKPPKYKKQFLMKRLAYRIQAAFADSNSLCGERKLNEKARQCLKNVAASDPMATVLQRKPTDNKAGERILPGTRFVRVWNGRRYEVIAREKGFEYEGCIYRSLSAVADKITGTHWNGKVFFGLKKGASRTGNK